MKYLIQSITMAELEEVMLNWSNKLGWNYSKEDVKAYYKINSGNIYSLKILNSETKDFELIGCISISTYTKNITITCQESISSLGLFVIKETHRGKSLGQHLLNYALSQLHNSTTLSLNSVPRAIPYYSRNGFFSSNVSTSHFALSPKFLKKPTPNDSLNNCLVLSGSNALDKIFEYEIDMFSSIVERQKFLKVWAKRSDAILVSYENGERLEGYGILTVCANSNKNSYRVSPMLADTIDVAASLFKKIFSLIGDSNFELIELNALNGTNAHLGELLTDLGFSKSEDGDSHLMTHPSLISSDFKSNLYKVIAMSPLEFPNEKLLINTPNRLIY